MKIIHQKGYTVEELALYLAQHPLVLWLAERGRTNAAAAREPTLVTSSKMLSRHLQCVQKRETVTLTPHQPHTDQEMYRPHNNYNMYPDPAPSRGGTQPYDSLLTTAFRQSTDTSSSSRSARRTRVHSP